jgi:fructokinase
VIGVEAGQGPGEDVLVGAVEAGGTKMVCAVGSGPDDVRDVVRFPTEGPRETLAAVVDWFRGWERRHGRRIQALGYGTFGPCDPDPTSPGYGRITTTPKPGWSGADVVGTLRAALGVPIGFDTDVDAAALAELRWGALRGTRTGVYLTVGTGIGGGVVADGRVLHGMLHPEIGHVRVPRDPRVDPYPGRCPFHGDCVEGLASGPANAERWGAPGADLPPEHPAWALEAGYLAHLCATLVCTLSPERIVLGGGVMAQEHLFALLRPEVQRLLNGYVATRQILEGIDAYLVPPALGDRAGVVGALALGLDALAGVAG